MTWRKSSQSETGGQCVEVRSDLAAIRDSKYPEATMVVGRTAMTKLTTFAKIER
ncbi:MAG TPA: DUF397 domain-containing protein [Actinophytocola sp.]|nr:DUF397 domain-containing protein [Actinophytocola sp.]HEU5472583.1 DUF397 domain-containing protein [Actinophytocola sp.]